MKSAIDYFTSITDPRIERTKEHHLSDIIFISIAAVICGAETWNDIEAYGKAKEDWLKQYLELKHGIPSHDTFNRFFSSIEPKEFERCFLNWIKDVTKITDGEVVSIDGKSIRGSKKQGGKAMVHMVSAWAHSNRMVLGQVKVNDKSNEITAIPKLLEVLAIKGCIVTIDAMGCQTNIAKKIIEKEADYVLSVKGNQGSLEESIKETLKFSKPSDIDESDDVGHGRVEKRVCKIFTDLSHIENKERWEELKCIVVIESMRYIKSTQEEQKETRFYISSANPNAKLLQQAIRYHWAVENNLHWVLDVAFNEDKSTKTNENAVQNFSALNRVALNLVTNEKSKKRSVKGKRLDAGWNNDYIIKILKN